MLQDINGGNGEQYFRNNSRGEGEDLPNWRGRLDLDRFLIAGHSFGGTSSVRLCILRHSIH